MRVRSHDFMVLEDALPGSTFRVYWDEALRKEAKGKCLEHAPDEGDTFWVTVWNRTGLTDHQEQQVNYSQGLDFTIRLPSDPPYLVLPGMNCLPWFYAEFNSTNWRRVAESKDDARSVEASPNLVAERNRTSVEVRIPAGMTRAASSHPIRGLNQLIEIGPLPGAVERTGARYGTLDFRQPGGHLLDHLYFTPIDEGWDYVHAVTSMPGDYQFEVNLTAPAVEETVWRAEFFQFVFTPRITELGFERPFKLYWQP